jgi:hypothetical protein
MMDIDAGILEDVLWHIHNWFERNALIVHDCEIQGGTLPASVADHIPDGAWYRIEGSFFNEGLHSTDELTDETFTGKVTVCAIPPALLRVVERIQKYEADTAEAYDRARTSPYKSESFGGYSYTLKDDISSQSGSGGLSGWKLAFVSDLNPWRKIG